jgi:putative ABC transport system permease protein
MNRAGRDDVAIILSRDAGLENTSRLSKDEAEWIAQMMNDEALGETARNRIVSPELVRTVDTLSRGGEAGAQLLARGLTADGVQLRPTFRIVEGRMYTPGRLEVIVGRRLAEDFAGLSLGTTLTGATQEWSIVGVFEDGGSTAESEVWMDLESARAETQTRDALSSIRVQLRSAADVTVLREVLNRGPQLQVQVATARDHQTKQFSQAIGRVRLLAAGLALMLGIGAVVATINTISAAIAARQRAVVTMRALGFSPASTAMAVFIEATLQGVIGGAVGACAAFLVADGRGLSILNGATHTPFALSTWVTAKSFSQGIVLGGLLSAGAAILPSIAVGGTGAPRSGQC